MGRFYVVAVLEAPRGFPSLRATIIPKALARAGSRHINLPRAGNLAAAVFQIRPASSQQSFAAAYYGAPDVLRGFELAAIRGNPDCANWNNPTRRDISLP
jgi:hypothetical protein